MVQAQLAWIQNVYFDLHISRINILWILKIAKVTVTTRYWCMYLFIESSLQLRLVVCRYVVLF